MEFDENMNGKQEQTGLEISPTTALAAARAEIEGALVLSKRFPRNELQVQAEIVKACQRPGMAADAEYVFPRGGKDVSGPSVYLARELARIWGNIRYGVTVIRDDQAERTIEAYAWDTQTNARSSAQDTFRKLIYRKPKLNKATGEETGGGWIEPDERDLRELTNRRAAILIRNCLLSILPSDIVNEALEAAHATMRNKAAKDPQGELKKIIFAFSNLNINPIALETFLGHSLETISPSEIVDLRGVYKSISEGNSTWNEYMEQAAEKKPPLKKAERPAVPPTAPVPPPSPETPPDWDVEAVAVEAEAVLESYAPQFEPTPQPPPRPVAAPRPAPAAETPAPRPRPVAAPPATPPPPAPPPPDPEQATAPKNPDKKISQEQWRALFFLSKDTGWKEVQLRTMLGSFQIVSPNQITESLLPKLTAIVKAGPPKEA